MTLLREFIDKEFFFYELGKTRLCIKSLSAINMMCWLCPYSFTKLFKLLTMSHTLKSKIKNTHGKHQVALLMPSTE